MNPIENLHLHRSTLLMEIQSTVVLSLSTQTEKISPYDNVWRKNMNTNSIKTDIIKHPRNSEFSPSIDILNIILELVVS